MIVIQYIVSEVCYTTWDLNFEATQTRDTVAERVDRVTVQCPRATHVGVVPRDIVVCVGVHHPHVQTVFEHVVPVSTRVTLREWCCRQWQRRQRWERHANQQGFGVCRERQPIWILSRGVTINVVGVPKSRYV